MKKSSSLKNIFSENINITKKKDTNLNNIKLNNSDQNILKIKSIENSEEAKEENNKIIIHRSNVINKNLGDETNRANKNSENSEHKEIQEQK